MQELSESQRFCESTENLFFKQFVNHSFFQCLDEDFEGQFIKALNCSPPYITENKKVWCREAVNISPTASSLLFKFGDGRKKSERCLPPCKVTRFKLRI